MNRADQIRIEFERFVRLRPEVYNAFAKFALACIDSGATRLSSKHIIENIRNHPALTHNDKPFKICNNYTALFARMFVTRWPQHAHLFVMRGLISADDPPTLKPEQARPQVHDNMQVPSDFGENLFGEDFKPFGHI